MIEAGQESEVEWGDGNWIFLDIGFAQRGNKSCGLLFGSDRHPSCVSFDEARKRILNHIGDSSSPVKLVIEAPLSVCFDQLGNPKGRKIEKTGNRTRYWYAGLGCAVMVAATYLIREIRDSDPRVPIRLFEGFVSFKDPSIASGHSKDVSLLREVVRDRSRFPNAIYNRDDLRTDATDTLVSAFRVAGLDCGIPVVLKPEPFPDPEVLRIIGKESKRKGTHRLGSKQIDRIIKAARQSKSRRFAWSRPFM